MRERLRFLDTRLLLPMVLLVVMGTLTVYSAGRGTSQSTLWLKQTLWTLLGFLALAAVAAVNPLRTFRSALPLYILGILSLVAVLAAGHRIGGAQRWLVIGHMTWQPSELMKWLTLLFVTHRLGTRPLQEVSAWDLVGASVLVFFPMLLVLKQPDLGMAISFLPILLMIPLLKGLKAKWVIAGLLGVSLLGAFAWRQVLKPYQKQRVATFLDPGADLQGKGYQINQSRIAIGAGGLFGQGFTSGSQTQLNFLPVKTTDFVFSVWAEERGFLGVLLALGAVRRGHRAHPGHRPGGQDRCGDLLLRGRGGHLRAAPVRERGHGDRPAAQQGHRAAVLQRRGQQHPQLLPGARGGDGGAATGPR